MLTEMQAPYPGGAFLNCYGHVRNLCVSRCVGRSTVMLPFSSFSSPSTGDEFKDAAPSLLKERLSFVHETRSLSNANLNYQSTTLSSIEKNIGKLEHVLIQSEEEIYGIDEYPNPIWEAQRNFDTLQEEIYHLQILLDSKEISLKDCRRETTVLKTHLLDAEAQASSLYLFKESYEVKQAEELSRLEKLSLESLEILDKHFIVNEAMSKSMEKVEKVWETIINFQSSSTSSKLIEILQREASLYFQELNMCSEELQQKKIALNNTLLKLQKSVDEQKEKDLEISRLQQELAKENQNSNIISKELAKAEAELSFLQQKLINSEGLLEKERKSLRAAREGLEELDRALGNEESKVDDLFKEVSALKAQLEQKETTVQSLTNQVAKNKGLQEIARKHLAAFHQSEKKVQQLTAQCNSLENQIKSKDVLLGDIRKEAFDKTEALRLAAQIKQELNLCRHREVQLTQELERERLQAKDLSHELMENSRAVKAELALRQAEKDMMNLKKELALLRKGIESRNDAIKLLQDKMDGNIQILQSASNDRETMRKMEAYIQSLESKLKEYL